MRGFAGASYASLFSFALCVVPLLAAAWFAVRPSERLLAVMRPLTLGAVFSALCGFVLAIANGVLTVNMMHALDLTSVHWVATAFSEGLAPVVASFASLTVTWFLVAIGMRKG